MSSEPKKTPSPKRPKAPTMDDVAAEANVSRALVSLVMRGSPQVSAKRRKAVLESADRLGYRPNAVARNLAQRRSNTLGVVVNDLHNTFFADVVDGIHEVAAAGGFRLLLSSARRLDVDEYKAVEAFLEHRVDAVLVVGPRAETSLLQVTARETPLITIGKAVEGIDGVVNDDQRGGELVVEHLTSLGHKVIAHVDGGLGSGATLRRHGFEVAMEERGLDPWVVPGDYTEQSGAESAAELLKAKRRPTAIFAANDLSALGVIDTLEAADVRVPQDVSVVGYDNTYIAKLHHVSLTTIHQPRVDMGRKAAEIAIERLATGRRRAVCHVLTPELVVRSTTAAPTD